MVTDKDREAIKEARQIFERVMATHMGCGSYRCISKDDIAAAAVIQAAIAEDRAGRQFAHDIILDNLVSWGVLTDELQDDPRAALWKLIELERDAARDPRIDEKAAEMVSKAIAEHDAQLVKWLEEYEHEIGDPWVKQAIEAKEPWK